MALAPQRGAGLMSLMVGMSIGLGVLLLANEQLRQLGARYRANQARDQETESFRVAWRFLAHHARASGGHSVVLDDGRAESCAPVRPWSPSGRVAGDQLNGSQPLSMGLAAVDCLGRQTSRNNRIHSSLWVRDGSLRCQVPDRAYNQPLSDGWQRLDVQVAVATPTGIQWVVLAPLATPQQVPLAYQLCLVKTPDVSHAGEVGEAGRGEHLAAAPCQQDSLGSWQHISRNRTWPP